MAKYPSRLFYILIFCILWSIGYTQDLREYRKIKILSGQSIDVPAESSAYPEFIRRPKDGNVSKFKFGYEEVYRIRYTAPSSFIGVDTVIYKTKRLVSGIPKPFFEGFVVEVTPTIAKDDYYAVDVNEGSVILPVLDNDQSVAGSIGLSKLFYVTSGSATITADGKNIRFTPGVSGFAKIGYSVCAGGSCAAGQVIVRVDDSSLPIRGDSTRYEIMRDDEAVILVGKGFTPPSTAYFSGTLTKIDDQIFKYEPALGFSGNEVLKFSQLIGGVNVQHVISIYVRDPFVDNGWNTDDHFYTEIGNPVSFSVLENDLGGLITIVNTSALQGNLNALGQGNYQFVPKQGFKGQTKFSYRVCEENRCDVAEVILTVHNYEPLYDVIQLYAGKNTSLHIDYKVPIDDFQFEVLEHPSNGQIQMAPDGRSFTYEPNSGFVGQDKVKLSYRVGAQGFSTTVEAAILVQDVTTPSCTDCVWPGDHNNDGHVDVQDAVVLATNIGYSGPSRPASSSHVWLGQSSENWPAALSYGTPNLKYVDSNGDGLISVSDLQLLSQHYMKAHGIISTPPLGSETIPLKVNVLTPEVEAGEWAVIEVSLGSASFPVHDLLGLNFSLEMGGRYVDSSSVRFIISDHGIFNPINSVIAFAQSPKDGTIDVGIGKTDKQPIRGHGVLGQIRFIVEEDLNGFRSLKDLLRVKLKASKISVHSSNQLNSIADVEGSWTIIRPNSTKEDFIFPNPAQSWVQLPTGTKSINLLNINGQVVSTRENRDSNAFQIDVSGLPVGLYFIELVTDSGEHTMHKIEILR